MAKMGLSPIYQRPRTSDPHPQHRIYPYLLRHLTIERANHVWCADITYIPMRRGFLYLVAIMDWATQGAGVAPIKYHGRRLLRHGAGGGADALWHPCYFQYGSRQPVQQLRLYRCVKQRRVWTPIGMISH